jgi:hypothetical protein
MLEHLFGTLPKFLHRRDAPETSVQAAHSVDSKTLEKLVYEVIRSHPEGCISDDILAELLGLPYGSITARYKALKTKKLIEVVGTRVGRSGKAQGIMKAI